MSQIRGIYTVFVGILFAAFIGVGIQLFYPAPKEPQMPASLKIAQPESKASVSDATYLQLKKDQETFDKAQQDFFAQTQVYNRNVSIVAIIASVLVLAASLTFAKQILLLADGLLLGGVLTLGYGIIRGFGTDDNLYRFIAVAAGLAVTLVIGYLKIIKPAELRPPGSSASMAQT